MAAAALAAVDDHACGHGMFLEASLSGNRMSRVDWER